MSGSFPISKKRSAIQVDSSIFCEGDIILRNGIGIISEFFSSFSLNDKSFSHAGILLKKDSVWVVCHSLGGESVSRGGVFMENLNDFCSPKVTDSVFVVRLTDDPTVRQALKSYCKLKMSQGVLFDRDFSLSDSTEMYCTEFVYRAYKAASSDAISLPLTSFNGIEYVSCDNLYLNKYAQPVLK